MPATDRPTTIAMIVYCAINASNIERSQRRRTFGGLAAAGAAGLSAVWRRRGGGRLRLQPYSCGLVLGQDLIEARLQPPIGALAGPELARPVQGNHVAHLALFGEHQARRVLIAPDQAGQTRKSPARDFEINPVRQDGRILELDFRAAWAEIAHEAVKRRVAGVERDHSAVIDAVSRVLTALQHDVSSMHLTI